MRDEISNPGLTIEAQSEEGENENIKKLNQTDTEYGRERNQR